ncbi:outer membrane beta-barrel protein [Aliiglaciecola sp. CAU 1673]|uniref:OmpW family outer membrane protein n=1 Tax=Aliiglaciecola sp. CAU 1673 TaxID=3032595 RepID=UPI0023DB62C8|nr:OmpW family outer membrane protein [Aliiglaciecola sp. CAU 1673]MDF2180125.1 outer membrane beta-barrel protein [Aliiglaciecola sp. CAU 1673]
MKALTLITLAAGLVSTQALAQSWMIKPYFGLSQLSDTQGQSQSLGTQDGQTKVDLDSGFVAGLGLGYQLDAQWRAELAWEYRSNDSVTTLADGQRFTEGNYASNTFALNGYYLFADVAGFQPYSGAGLVWIQEIDLDLERNGEEQSLSGSSDTGFQLMLGIEYQFNASWQAQAELRYTSLTGIGLQDEGAGNAILRDLDYQPLTFAINLLYRF